jgi:ribonuclease PH
MGRLLISTPLGHLPDLLTRMTCMLAGVVALADAGAGTLGVVDYLTAIATTIASSI